MLNSFENSQHQHEINLSSDSFSGFRVESTLETFAKQIQQILTKLFKRLSEGAAEQNVRVSRLPNLKWVL